MFNYKEARKFVKENISGKAASIFGYAILYFIVKGLIAGLIGSFDGALGYFLPAVVAAFVTPIQVGLFRIVTKIMNSERASFGMLFEDYKYFINLFVIGLVFNLIIGLGYEFPIVGVLLDYIYVGVLYFFIYNSDLSIGDFFKNVFGKIKDYFSECIILELSYIWPFILTVFLYLLSSGVLLIVGVVSGLGKIAEISNIDDVWPLFSSFIPLIVVSGVFLIIMLVLAIRILPRLLLAEAKFYSVYGSDKEVKVENKSKFCSNCGSKVEGKFCTNCGNKIEG